MMSVPRKAVAAFIVATLAAASLFLLTQPQGEKTVHAEFAQVDGMFVGSNVAILGVNIGRVTELEPKGDHVRLSMAVPADTQIPANAEAWVMSPNVVSDQYIELTPPYRGGKTMPDGGVIPVERSHSPIKWDRLVASVNDLLVTFGPEGANSDGSLGSLLDNSAKMLDGNGKKIRKSIMSLTQATDVVNGEMPDIKSLLSSLDSLVKVLSDNKSTVDSLTRSVDSISGELAAQEGNIADAIGSLGTVMDEVGRLVRKHGKSTTTSVKRLADVSVELAEHQRELVEIMDTFPLAADNLGRAITDDNKLRVRLDVTASSSGSQLGAFREMCASFEFELLCERGINNPIELPPDLPIGSLGGGG